MIIPIEVIHDFLLPFFPLPDHVWHSLLLRDYNLVSSTPKLTYMQNKAYDIYPIPDDKAFPSFCQEVLGYQIKGDKLVWKPHVKHPHIIIGCRVFHKWIPEEIKLRDRVEYAVEMVKEWCEKIPKVFETRMKFYLGNFTQLEIKIL